MPLRTGKAAEADPDTAQQQQQLKLWVLCRRTLALGVGRGAFTLGTLAPLLTEPLPVPKISLAGRLPDLNNAVVNLDVASVLGPAAFHVGQELTCWPEFHNGCAAGLRLKRAAGKLNRAWILYNRPAKPSWSHAGLILGLGLSGALAELSVPDVYDYLRQEHAATAIAVLLGMAAARRGSMDAAVYKMLFLHVPSRHPSSFPEIEISPLVQSAAVLGAGLLYQGSGHRLMCEILLEELAGRPGILNTGGADGGVVGTGGGAVSNSRECYSLSAGLALGMVLAGKGRSVPGLADLHVEERLRALMVGRTDPLEPHRGGTPGRAYEPRPTEARAPAPGPPSVPLAAWAEDADDAASRFPPWDPLGALSGGARAGGEGSGASAEERSQSAHPRLVLEGPGPNLEVVSPGATLALALMFLKTNDAEVAAKFTLPQSKYALDLVRPDALQLRCLARCLVMWDAVRPSAAWLEAQLPSILRPPLDATLKSLGKPGVSRGDVEAAAHARLAAVSGLCLGVGLRFAGSHDPAAFSLLRDQATALLQLRSKAPESSAGLLACSGRLDKQTLEAAIDAILLAMAVVMAGSGHLPTLRLLRAASKRLQRGLKPTQHLAHQGAIGGLTFGNHLAISTALGFLFLGGGTLTFSTSNEAIAALVTALFPVLPQTTADNKVHLQAYRHFYALAVEDRCLRAVDADAGADAEGVAVPLEIDVLPVVGDSTGPEGTPEVRRMLTPCLLPERSRVLSIRVGGRRYWPIDLSDPAALDAVYAARTIHVKKKSGVLSYEADPTGVRSLLAGIGGSSALGALLGTDDETAAMTTSTPAPAAAAAASLDRSGALRLASRYARDPSVGELMRAVRAYPPGPYAQFARGLLQEGLLRDRSHVAVKVLSACQGGGRGCGEEGELLRAFATGWLGNGLRLAHEAAAGEGAADVTGDGASPPPSKATPTKALDLSRSMQLFGNSRADRSLALSGGAIRGALADAMAADPTVVEAFEGAEQGALGVTEGPLLGPELALVLVGGWPAARANGLMGAERLRGIASAPLRPPPAVLASILEGPELLNALQAARADAALMRRLGALRTGTGGTGGSAAVAALVPAARAALPWDGFEVQRAFAEEMLRRLG